MSGDRVVLLGGTKGIGRAVARLLAERGDKVVLLGRDMDELERSAADLAVRSGSEAIPSARCDLADPSTFAAAVDHAERVLGGIDRVVVTAADFATQERLEEAPERAIALCAVNFSNTVGFCERARTALARTGGGVLCVFSSVAGDRGRRPVVIYGASKAGVSAYLEGLDHKFRRDGLRTVCVKPGFVHTSMTAGLSPPPFAGEPEEVAAMAIRGMDRGTPVVYAPSIWRWVMLIIRQIPRIVMRRIGF